MENVDVVPIFLAIISIVALIGNGLVVFLLLRKRDWSKKVHSCLLLALAVQDIFTAIGLFGLPGFVQPSNVYELPESAWLRQLFCSIIWSRYIAFALAITSVYTCLMLAVDRWVAVFRPMSYRRFSISGKVIAVMVILPWFAGFGFEINTALNVRYMVQSDETCVCKWNQVDTSARSKSVAVFTFIGMIVLPAILMILVYTKIVLRRKEQAARIIPQLYNLRRHDSVIKMQNSLTTPNRSRIKSNSAPNVGSSSSLKRLTRIACAASTIVVVCWLPDQFYFCLFQLGLQVNLRNELHNALIILAFLNTCLNPILYVFCDKQYAAEFKMSLRCVYHRERTTSVVQQVQSERT